MRLGIKWSHWTLNFFFKVIMSPVMRSYSFSHTHLTAVENNKIIIISSIAFLLHYAINKYGNILMQEVHNAAI